MNSVTQIVRKVAGDREGQFEDRRIREEHVIDQELVYVTYICFRLAAEPPFLRDSDLQDEKHAFLLLLELPDTIVLFKRNVSGAATALAPFIVPWSYEHLGGVYADEGSAYERISLRNMSLAASVVRRRSLEADNLAESMAVAGLHRSIPNSFRTRDETGVHTITPSTSRIARRDPRVGLSDLVRWARRTSRALETGPTRYGKTFLAEFCRALPLAELPDDVTPNAILFDLTDLSALWEADRSEHVFSISRTPRADEGHELTEMGTLALFDLGQRVFEIQDDRITYTSAQGKQHTIGWLRRNKRSITVRSGLLDRVSIRSHGKTVRLSTYLNDANNFVITFTNPEFGYAERQLFRDQRLLGTVDSLLQLFSGRHGLVALSDEKAPQVRVFGREGVFRFVEDHIVPANATLVCDDLGDEWADYIAVDDTSPTTRLLFIHCKHAELTTSASALHAPIGQAVKNLSRMFRPAEAFERKVDQVWVHDYSGTNIPRIRRGGDANAVKRTFRAAISAPSTERVALLVLSGLSRQAIGDEFAALARGTARPHVSQLLWLLASFVASCREHGVRGEIICQP